MKVNVARNRKRQRIIGFVLVSGALLLVATLGLVWIINQSPDPNTIPVYPGAQRVEPLLTNDFGVGFNAEIMRQFSYEVGAKPQMVQDFYKQSLASTRWYESSPGNDHTMIFGWTGPFNNRAGEVTYSLLINTEANANEMTRVEVALIRNTADCC